MTDDRAQWQTPALEALTDADVTADLVAPTRNGLLPPSSQTV